MDIFHIVTHLVLVLVGVILFKKLKILLFQTESGMDDIWLQQRTFTEQSGQSCYTEEK